jgi:hypothetical protein
MRTVYVMNAIIFSKNKINNHEVMIVYCYLCPIFMGFIEVVL